MWTYQLIVDIIGNHMNLVWSRDLEKMATCNLPIFIKALPSHHLDYIWITFSCKKENGSKAKTTV